MGIRRRSPYPAFLVAAPSAVVLWVGLYLLHALAFEGPARAAGLVPYLLIGAILFALPFVVVLLVAVALPTFLLIRAWLDVTLPTALAAGAACGALARWGVALLWAEPETSFLPWTVAVLTGIGTAAVWWRAWVGPEREGLGTGRGAL